VQDAATLAALDLGRLGPPIEGNSAFPNRTNVSWYTELQPGPTARIRARIFERGVGETLSSGTGASGAAVAYLLSGDRLRLLDAGGNRARVIVVLDGGELEVEVDAQLHVRLSGWALPVFEGRLSEDFVSELRQAA
jgi:diaminopimelate epimerase